MGKSELLLLVKSCLEKANAQFSIDRCIQVKDDLYIVELKSIYGRDILVPIKVDAFSEDDIKSIISSVIEKLGETGDKGPLMHEE